MKKTLVLGANTNPDRYSFKAAHSLIKKGHEIVLVGVRSGEVAGKEIVTEKKYFSDIDTVTLYVSPKNQVEWYDYILELNPKRVIFNPGTENIEFENLLEKNDIETLEACTLVLLAIGDY